MLLHTLEGHTGAVFTADMDEKGSIVITGSADRVRLKTHVETFNLFPLTNIILKFSKFGFKRISFMKEAY